MLTCRWDEPFARFARRHVAWRRMSPLSVSKAGAITLKRGSVLSSLKTVSTSSSDSARCRAIWKACSCRPGSGLTNRLRASQSQNGTNGSGDSGYLERVFHPRAVITVCFCAEELLCSRFLNAQRALSLSPRSSDFVRSTSRAINPCSSITCSVSAPQKRYI